MLCDRCGFTTADFFEDLVNALGPLKRFWARGILIDVSFDGLGQFIEAGDAASPDAFAGDFRKPALDQIEPRRTGGRDMQMESGMFFEPGFDGWVFVRRVVVDD